MRKFLSIKSVLIGIAVALALIACARMALSYFSAGVSDALLGVSNLRQIVAQDNRTERMLMWQSDKQREFAVEYRTKDGVIQQTVKATDCSFNDADAKYLQYKAKLQGLSDNTVYEYRLLADGQKGTWHTLKTDAGKSFKAIIFADSQSSDYRTWQRMAAEAYKRNSDAQLYLNLGDLVDNGQDINHWRGWFEGIKGFAPDVPLAAVVGNHETYTLDWQVGMPVSFVNMFAFPANGNEKYQNQFYSFDYGDVHFAVVDTNYSNDFQKFQPELKQDEIAWLETDLANTTKPWKIILQHRDVFIYGFGAESGREHTFDTHFIEVGQDLMPIYEKYGVNAVLSGHLHTYRRRVPLRNFEPNQQGITYIMSGISGNVQYPKLWSDFAWDAGRAPEPEVGNYMTLEASADKLVFRAFLIDGKQFDEVTITKH